MKNNKKINFFYGYSRILLITETNLNIDKGISLLSVYEENSLRSLFVIVKDVIITSLFADAADFFEDINLFNNPNNKNKYFEICSKGGKKQLKLNINTEPTTYLETYEVKSIYKIFNHFIYGPANLSILRNEFKLSPIEITELLHEYDYFVKKGQ